MNYDFHPFVLDNFPWEQKYFSIHVDQWKMETDVSDKYKDGHYHDASEHGVVWAVLNEMLHLIVFVYTLYGMIQFKVKFIHAVKLVRWLSYLIIAHSWYLTIKFTVIAIVMYMFNEKLESMGTFSLTSHNCSMGNHSASLEGTDNPKKLAMTKLAAADQMSSSNSIDRSGFKLELQQDADDFQFWFPTLPDFLTSLNFHLMYAQFLDVFGGPFKWLGNRATLMYGFYAISIYIMLAIFPVELMYSTVGFNFIRFVLSDSSCMRDLYNRRERHLNRLTSWSRNQTNSELTLGTKMTLNQRDLRSRYADDCNRLAIQLVMANMGANKFDANRVNSLSENSNTDLVCQLTAAECKYKNLRQLMGHDLEREVSDRSGPWSKSIIKRDYNNLKRTKWSNSDLSKMATAEYKLAAGVKPLRSRLAINHMDAPTYQVRVANKNLKKFKPFIRSESWFKLSMIVYPVFIFYYFSLLTLVVGTITIYFGSTLRDVSDTCARQVDPEINLWTDWTTLDNVIYFETQYSVFAISCASSFYCSYYFGTIMELYIWKQELQQQMDLSRIVIEISEHSQRHIGVFASLLPSSCEQVATIGMLKAKDACQLCRFCRGGEGKASNSALTRGKGTLSFEDEDLDRKVEQCFNEFGGIKSYWINLKLAQSSSQAKRFRTLELMAIKLLQKKQTLSRATYVNMNLFFDELNETRFMNNTILRRTTQIAFGFALLASVTRSQFKANYWHLTFFLAACLAILNLYLACAAIINSSVSISIQRH